MAMADGGNQGPFGEMNFFVPNGHWPSCESIAKESLQRYLCMHG